MQRNGGAVFGLGGQVADRGIAFLRPRLHCDFVFESCVHGIVGSQVHDPLIAVHQDIVAVKCLAGDTFCVDHKRNCPSPCYDCRMAAHRAVFENDPFEGFTVFEQFARANVAGHEDRVFGHVACVRALTGEDA